MTETSPTSLTALTALLVDLLAISCALIILTLNLLGVWVGNELPGDNSQDGKKLFAIQLAAKIHEILVLASISRLVWATVLRSLVHGSLPFAMLNFGMKITDVNILWSKELFALCLAPFAGKWLFLFLMTISVFLGLTVGPASATGLSPGLSDWPADRLIFHSNATQDQL
jgi:hypothetical protein